MRWIIRVAGTLLLLALLAVAALFLVPTEKVANLAASELRRITGRELHFDGAVRPTIWPHLGVRTGAVRLANTDWSREGPMLTAKALSISLDIPALLGGMVRVTGMELVSPRLVLERAKDGRGNWDIPTATETGAAAGGGAVRAGPPLSIDRVLVGDGSVLWIDHRAGARTEVTGIALDSSIPDLQGKATFTVEAMVGMQAVAVAGTIGAVAAFLEGDVVPVAITARAGGSDLVFDGRFGLSPLAAEGKVEARITDLPALAALVGRAAPDIPAGMGRHSITVAGALTLTPEGSFHLRDGTIELDQNRFTGAIDLVPGKVRPKLTAKLATADLDLGAPGGAGAAGGSGSGGLPSGWSAAPIDASALGLLDAAVSLSADSIDFGSITFGRSRLSATIDAARAVIDLREVTAYGGTIAGQVIVNARKGLSARANLTLGGLSLQPLLSQLAGYDRLTGTGDLSFNLLGSGSSLDAMMKSLDGTGSLAFRKGEVRGLDLAGMIRTMDTSYVGEGSKTVFDSLTASFTVAGGVLANGDLAIAAPLVTAQGAGTVDIGNQRLDYRVTPLSLGGNELDTDLQVPVLISGSWASPKVRLDLETLTRRKLEEEAKKLEEKAKAELAKKMQEELGITQQDGESLEDLARRALQEALQKEAERQLMRLLGGDGTASNPGP